MITDRIENLWQYHGLHPNLDRLIEAFDFQCLDSLEDGRHERKGDPFFIRVVQIQSGQDGTWEAHRKYIEMHLVLEGEETIAWAPLVDIADLSGYNAQNDLISGADPKTGNRTLLQKGMFSLYFPGDAHLTGIGEGRGRKAVFSIRIEEDAGNAPQDDCGLSHQGSRVLGTTRLVLRPYRDGDESAMFDNWCGREELAQYLPWAPHKDRAVTKRILSDWLASYQNPRTYRWGIEMGGTLIGDIAVLQQSPVHLDCEIGYCLSPDYWNQGIMTEALIAVMDLLFAQVGFHRIYLRHQAENQASGRVMRKAGLCHEGTFRKAYKDRKGNYTDLLLFAAIREDWLMEHRKQSYGETGLSTKTPTSDCHKKPTSC